MARYGNLDKLELKWIFASPTQKQNFREIIEKHPTADVVEVVRCKNCEYWQDNNGGYPNEECRWGKDETPNADDFCSYGERIKKYRGG